MSGSAARPGCYGLDGTLLTPAQNPVIAVLKGEIAPGA